MSQVSVTPDFLTTAATELNAIGWSLRDAQKAAAPATVGLAPAAADEVSAGIAQLFAEHARDYYAAAEQAADYQERFVQKLTNGAEAYASAESANAASLNDLSFLVAAPVNGMFFAALAYISWVQPLLSLLPAELQGVALLPAGLFFLGGLAGALLLSPILGSVSLITGNL